MIESLIHLPKPPPMKLSPVVLVLATMAVASLAAQDDLPPKATEKWEPVPPIVSAPANGAPGDASALFTGTNLDAWESVKGGKAQWKVEDGAFLVAPGMGDIRTKKSFGDIQLHLEFRTPTPAAGKGQGRGNSGVFFMERYELQILDSYDNVTYSNGQAASIYKQHIPLVNASRPPGEWQTYDVLFFAPRIKGSSVIPARVTVFHNGVLVQHDVMLRGATAYQGEPMYERHGEKEPLRLQDHGNPVAFRNIWIRELNLPAKE